jgi:tetratricopeptide (TPR) repeat protein
LRTFPAKKYSTTHFVHLYAVVIAMASVLQAGTAAADNYQDASRLFKQGDMSTALSKVEAHLVAKPHDAQARFLKGVILSEQQKTTDAIRIFTALTEDHPELPEPYNNLAVLYANQSQYDKARNALEMAIRTHPSYSVAHENLGDIYAAMASQAYDKALKLDSANNGIKAKLSLIKEIFTPLPSGKGGSKIESATSAAAPANKPAVVIAEATKPATTPAKVMANDKVLVNDEIAATLRNWTKAWSAQNVDAYLAHYAANFKVPGGEARAQWEASRRERISRPKRIEVSIANVRVTPEPDGEHAIVTFRQTYRSDTLKSAGTKTLIFAKTDNRWLILEERVHD